MELADLSSSTSVAAFATTSNVDHDRSLRMLLRPDILLTSRRPEHVDLNECLGNINNEATRNTSVSPSYISHEAVILPYRHGTTQAQKFPKTHSPNSITKYKEQFSMEYNELYRRCRNVAVHDVCCLNLLYP